MKKGGVALIGMILALVLILVTFIGPWYSGEEDYSGVKVESNLYLTNAVQKGAGVEQTIEYSTMGGDIESLMGNMYLIVIVTLIFSILALIGILGLTFNFGPANTMKIIGGLFGILTFILGLVAIFYFMTGLPETSSSITGFWMDSAGPGYAWYLMLVAAIIALISSIPLFKKQAA